MHVYIGYLHNLLMPGGYIMSKKEKKKGGNNGKKHTKEREIERRQAKPD
jgi:hypothetical protein